MTGKASETYAKALLGVMRQGDLSAARAELEEVVALFDVQPEYYTLLCSPAIAAANRRELLSPLEGKLTTEMYHFLLVLSDHGRFSLLHDLAKAFYGYCDDELGILRVEAATAVPLSETQSEKLKAKLESVTGKTVILSNRVDASLLGGVVLTMNHQELDGSVRAKLDGLKQSLAQSIV